jgi:hypothetical protein
MQVLKIVKSGRFATQISGRVVAPVLVLLLLLGNMSAWGAAFYSSGAPVNTSAKQVCLLGCVTIIDTDVSTPVGGVAISAAVNLPLSGSTRLRYQLLNVSGSDLTGYRAGILLSANRSLLGLSAVGTITIRTYLSTGPNPDKSQQDSVISGSVANARLLAGRDQPSQFEITATKNFDQVEIEFASVLSLGLTVNVNYAYAVSRNRAAQITGLTSNSTTSTPGTFSTSGDCAEKVANPSNAVDNSQTNYATFSSLASVFCTSRLTVGLTGTPPSNTAPSNYKAGFVIGQDNNLLDVSILSSLTIRTYKNGVLQESGTGASLLGLSVLPDNKSLVTFQATKQFDAVSIERNDAVALLDDLRLYYGVGVASTTPQQIISSFPSSESASHAAPLASGLLCALCSVSDPEKGAGSPNSAATINVGVGLANWSGLRLDLNGAGLAGNRAGMVLGNNSLVDLEALSRVTLVTYDANGNVLETANGLSLIKLNLLPDGRQSVSFNTTKDFAKVGIQISGLVSAVSNTSVYYAFSDNSNGTLNIVTPTSPLPVTLTSFTVRRAPTTGAAVLNWTTATELNSASFVVERSTSPAAGFVAVGQVAAAGNSTTVRTYSLQDAEASALTATAYYRLRQVDQDGSVHYSAVAVLSAGPASASFTLYPNPATASTPRVNISAAVAPGYSVNLYSNMGQLLSSRTVSSEGATAPLSVSTSGLAAGIYHVVLRDASGQPVGTQRLQVSGN